MLGLKKRSVRFNHGKWFSEKWKQSEEEEVVVVGIAGSERVFWLFSSFEETDSTTFMLLEMCEFLFGFSFSWLVLLEKKLI